MENGMELLWNEFRLLHLQCDPSIAQVQHTGSAVGVRSEERRVGKECRL